MLTGAGGFFSAGMDLKAFLRGETPAIEGRGLCGITRTPPRKPLIAAVEGGALAGGFELVLACDLVVAGRRRGSASRRSSARWSPPAVARCCCRSGCRGRVALELLLTGDPFDADRAQAVGLVNRVVDDGAALDAAVELAEAIAANGPLAVAATKQIVPSAPLGAGRGVGRGRTSRPARCSPRRTRARAPTAFAERRARRSGAAADPSARPAVRDRRGSGTSGAARGVPVMTRTSLRLRRPR